MSSSRKVMRLTVLRMQSSRQSSRVLGSRFIALNVRQLLDNVKPLGYIYVREITDNRTSRRGEGDTMTRTPQVGKPEKRVAGRWFVPSGTAGVGYTVERVDGRWRCTCPSFRWRHT